MPASYMPRTQAAQVAWAANMASQISGSPDYGVPEPLVTDFGTATGTLQAAYTVATEPSTRTKGTVSALHTALKAMRRIAGFVVKAVEANPNLTDQQRDDLGLRPRATPRKSIPEPKQSPFIKVKRVDGRTVHGELRQETSRRGKPADVAGATIFTHVGPTPPTANDWTFAQSITKTSFELTFGPSETGDTVWISAFWQNAKDESGPTSPPTRVELPAGGALPQEADERSPMRIAA